MTDNMIMPDPSRICDSASLFKILKETSQRLNLGPDAWKEIQTTRLRANKENVIGFLNCLLLLSFVINMSEDQASPTISEREIASKLPISLP